MEIKRIYNNNVVVTTDRQNQEMIAIGRGLGFQCKVGDTIDESRIEKKFTLQDKTVMTKLEELIHDMPSVYLSISEDIVKMIKRESDLKLSDNIYITLTDHISMSLEREKEGIVLANPLLNEIRQFYKVEYALAQKAVRIIEEKLNLKISEDETGFITLHIVNASLNTQIEYAMNITRMIQDVLSIVENHFQVKLNQNMLQYDRFVRHLHFFARRILDEKEEQVKDFFIFGLAKKEFPEAYQCVGEIKQFIHEKYGVEITDAEGGYLAYHIMNVLLKTKQ